MFAIPFVFAFYPELLMVDQALIDPSSPTGARLPGYENGVQIGTLMWLIVRLVLALYLVASALAAHDAKPLSFISVLVRLATASAILVKPEMVHFAAIAFAIGLLTLHQLSARRMQEA
jgi:hypothetical protein